MATKSVLQPTQVDDIALRNAELMREACLRAVARNGIHVVWSADELQPGMDGLFTDDDSPMGRRIIVKPGLHPIIEAVVLAHEVAHCCDPSLNHSAMRRYYADNVDVCEAVAHYAAYLVADAYYLLPYLEHGWFEHIIDEHFPFALLVADDDLVHRADRGAFQMLHPDAADDLRRRRADEGRPSSGMTKWQRFWEAARGKDAAAA